MSRLVWVALGAAGGVYAYRRGQRLLDEARERGIVGSVQAATGSATNLAVAARGLMAGSAAPRSGSPSNRPTRPASPSGRTTSRPGTDTASATATGAAAARVLAESQSRSRAAGAGDR